MGPGLTKPKSCHGQNKVFQTRLPVAATGCILPPLPPNSPAEEQPRPKAVIHSSGIVLSSVEIPTLYLNVSMFLVSKIAQGSNSTSLIHPTYKSLSVAEIFTFQFHVLPPHDMLWDRKAWYHLLFNHFGYVFNINLPSSQTINFPYNDLTSGSHPTLGGLCNSSASHGMQSAHCQQSELCCWALAWHWRIFHPSLCPGYAPSHPAHFETTTQRLCPTARHNPLPAFPLPDCQRESGTGRREGRGWRIKQDRPESLEFFP